MQLNTQMEREQKNSHHNLKCKVYLSERMSGQKVKYTDLVNTCAL